MTTESGRVASPTSDDGAPAGLHPTGFDPARKTLTDRVVEAFTNDREMYRNAGHLPMVERVARRIAASKRGLPSGSIAIDRVWSSYVGQARDAIDEMFEPNRHMLDIAGRLTGMEETALRIWVAMIAGALSDSDGSPKAGDSLPGSARE